MTQGLGYREGNTIVHRLSPVVRLGWGVIIVVMALLFDHPLYILSLLVANLALIAAAGVWREWASLLKLFLWLGIGIIIINALVSYHGDHVLAAAPFSLPVLGRPTITLEALAFGAVMAVRLLVVISAFAFVNLTVHPDDIMAVLLKMRLPYKSVLVTSLSTRFIPCLIEDIHRINDAYRTRGVSLDTGSRLRRIRDRAGTIIPLLSNSLDRAVQVAEAMEARAFGAGRKRSFYKQMRLSTLDRVILLVGLLPLGGAIIARVTGYGSYEYYPSLPGIDFSAALLIPVLLALLLLTVLPLSLMQRRLELD